MPEEQPVGVDAPGPDAGGNLYLGEPDARQAGAIAVSRFRPRYRALDAREIEIHDELKSLASAMEAYIDECALDGTPEKLRYKALAITALEQTVMWAVKALTL